MKKIVNFLFISLMLAGCIASASSTKKMPVPAAEIIEQDRNEMLELAREMHEERTQAIYIVVISKPEIVIAKPPEK